MIAKKFDDFIRENNLKRVVFHSLRHSSTSLKLKLSGGDIKAVQGDTGHAQANMVTDVYTAYTMYLLTSRYTLLPHQTVTGNGGGVMVEDWYSLNRRTLNPDQIALPKKMGEQLQGQELATLNSILSDLAPLLIPCDSPAFTFAVFVTYCWETAGPYRCRDRRLHSDLTKEI